MLLSGDYTIICNVRERPPHNTREEEANHKKMGSFFLRNLRNDWNWSWKFVSGHVRTISPHQLCSDLLNAHRAAATLDLAPLDVVLVAGPQSGSVT
jgi:hypothetical protein